jgi:DNA-binding NarL/FixJ family response regulator
MLRPFSYCLYSPKCVEGLFCELRLYGVLRSSLQEMAAWQMRRTRQGSYPTSVTSSPPGGGQRPFALRPDTKRKGRHVIGAEGRSRELRAQGAQLDAAARAAPGRRYLEAVREGTSAAKKPLGLVWVVAPSYSIAAAGLQKALGGKADVRIGEESSAATSPSCVVLYAGATGEGCLEGMARIRELYPGVPLLVFASHLDLALAWATLKNGADGFVHAQMHPAQVLRAVEVVQKGELAAPRQLLSYLLSQNENPKIGALSARKREILELVVEGLSNAEIAGRLYLSESTIKQHLRATYKLLGVRNRTEAARTMREHARGV